MNPCEHLVAALAIASLMTDSSRATGAPVYPLKCSANGRYLVDQNNAPYLIVGDSPQALIVNLTTNEAAAFFADRAALGFNTLWINLLCANYTGGRTNGSWTRPPSIAGSEGARSVTGSTWRVSNSVRTRSSVSRTSSFRSSGASFISPRL